MWEKKLIGLNINRICIINNLHGEEKITFSTGTGHIINVNITIRVLLERTELKSLQRYCPE